MSNQHPARGYFDRAKALAEEIAERQTDLKAVYAEAKEHGENISILRAAVKRSLETDLQASKRETKEINVRLLLEALGEYASTPLGQAATERAP